MRNCHTRNVIQECLAANPPGITYREIMRQCGISSTSVVSHHMKILRARMSGGSYAYTYEKVERFADALDAGKCLPDHTDASPTRCENHALRKQFAAHLRKVAAAMKAIEWVDSGDSSHPHDTAAIWDVIGKRK